MKKTERYLVRVIFENEKKIFVKTGEDDINDFFKEIFNDFPDAISASLRKIYNPLYSDSEIDDQRTFIARSRDYQLLRQNSIIEKTQKEVLYDGTFDEDS